jgi:hypothetical protein
MSLADPLKPGCDTKITPLTLTTKLTLPLRQVKKCLPPPPQQTENDNAWNIR